MNDETVTLRLTADHLLRAALWLGIVAEEADAGDPVPAHQRRDLLTALDALDGQVRLARAAVARLR